MSNTLYSKFLQDLGLPESRANSLDRAMGEVHRSISQLDSYNLEIVKREFPQLVREAAKYGVIEELNTFGCLFHKNPYEAHGLAKREDEETQQERDARFTQKWQNIYDNDMQDLY